MSTINILKGHIRNLEIVIEQKNKNDKRTNLDNVYYYWILIFYLSVDHHLTTPDIYYFMTSGLFLGDDHWVDPILGVMLCFLMYLYIILSILKKKCKIKDRQKYKINIRS